MHMAKLSPRRAASISERRGNKLKELKDFHLKAKAITWPRLSYMCHIHTKADLDGASRLVEFEAAHGG